MWTPPAINTLSPIATAPVMHRFAAVPPPQLDVVMLFGFFISILTLLIWMHPAPSRLNTLAFAVSLAGLAIYGFLQGAWPLGIVAMIWSAAALMRWRRWKGIPMARNKNRRAIKFPPRRGQPQRESIHDQLFEWN
jgi:hypothetical protein